MYNVTQRRVRATIVAVRKVISVTYSECVFLTTDIQHAMRMRLIVICGLPGSTIFFHIVSQNARFKKKKVIEHKMCVLIFSATIAWNISYSKKNGATHGQKFVLIWSARYYCPILMKLEFSRHFLENIKNFMKIPPVGTVLFHANGRTDMTKLIVTFGSIANAPIKTS